MSTLRQIRVFVAEDEQPILENIIEKIEKSDAGFLVAGSAMDGEDARKLIEQLRPDVLFTDIKMPLMDGIELIRWARKTNPGMHVVILSGYSEFSYAQQAMKLGVTDYLLKPLRMESLLETLRSIRSMFEEKMNALERDILVQNLNAIQPQNNLPSYLDKDKFVLCLVCIGNLYDRASYLQYETNFNELWRQVEWNHIVGASFGCAAKWWVVDEKLSNEKFLIISSDVPSEEWAASCAKKALKAIEESIPSFPVTLCLSEGAICYCDIWETARKVRLTLDKRLVLFQSSLIQLAEAEAAELPTNFLGLLTSYKIEKYLRLKQFDLLNMELKNIFDYWKRSLYPQKTVEEALLQLTRVILEQLDLYQDNTFISMQSDVYEEVAKARSYETLYEVIWQLYSSFFGPRKKSGESSEELYLQLEKYIGQNFAKPINVKFLAEKFKFNSSYIIRIFKKYKGEPPMQYLTSLRINEAKRLIENKPEMDLQNIAEIVGYTDQHYFSRVFKNICGLTPSDYRERMRKTPHA